jgi:hypothetical protein
MWMHFFFFYYLMSLISLIPSFKKRHYSIESYDSGGWLLWFIPTFDTSWPLTSNLKSLSLVYTFEDRDKNRIYLYINERMIDCACYSSIISHLKSTLLSWFMMLKDSANDILNPLSMTILLSSTNNRYKTKIRR